MAAGEQELYDGLFSSGKFIELDNENHEELGQAKDAHKQSLEDDYKKHYFQDQWFAECSCDSDIGRNRPTRLIALLSLEYHRW